MTDGPVKLMDLDARMCRWPVATRDGEHFFCGREDDGKSLYCERHHKVSVGNGTREERRASKLPVLA